MKTLIKSEMEKVFGGIVCNSYQGKQRWLYAEDMCVDISGKQSRERTQREGI